MCFLLKKQQTLVGTYIFLWLQKFAVDNKAYKLVLIGVMRNIKLAHFLTARLNNKTSNNHHSVKKKQIATQIFVTEKHL